MKLLQRIAVAIILLLMTSSIPAEELELNV